MSAVYFLDNYPSLSDPADITADQTMSMREQINQGDRDKDIADPDIAYDVLRSLITAIIQVTTTAISNATFPISVTTKTITYSSAIDPYEKKSLETKTKDGNYLWNLTTKTSEGWKMMAFPPLSSTPTRYWTSSRIVQSSLD